ncbi:MAG: hypothetical protein ABIR17_01240 [Pseudolysinimonas sp.]|uniref:hypothetical protein n=1 Tax=Pseudolysinimonas sp. TaxID=2680009 RepID=UPI003264CD59
MSNLRDPVGSRRAVFGLIALAAVVVGGATAVVFLIRAGGDPGAASTWPISWELRSSDNGTLFQFWGDVAAGRTLDWSFSPQVFVFPELPMSGIAFVVAGGSIYGYYLAVAILNQVVIFLLFVGLARTLWPTSGAIAVTLRAAIAIVPLLLIPLLGTSWVMSFHLAPTYYAGMYFALLGAPLLLLVTRPWMRAVIGVGLALTIASNPLTLVFAAPGLVAILVARLVRSGWRSTVRPAAWVLGLLAVAVIVRGIVTPLQGTGLFTYMNPTVFGSRLSQLQPYWAYQLLDPAAGFVLPLGALLALGCLAAAATAWVRLVAGRPAGLDAPRMFATVYLGLVPVGGLVATFIAMITHYYYFWPALILPFALVTFALPWSALRAVGIAGTAGLLIIGVATGGLQNLASPDRYFGYRGAETRCLDDAVPGQVGFATFSDARRVSLPSATGFRLIPVTPDVVPNLWLTNRAYSRSESGTFFYANEQGDERAIDGDVLRARFGVPDRTVSCGDGQTVWIYDHPVSVAGSG